MADHDDNICAGTQVVSRVEVRGTNNSLVHPRGAVGVVTRTPAGEEKHFLVRFPDGFEFSLEREQMEILKHFKARLGAAHTHSLAPIEGEGQEEGAFAANSAFDLETFIIYRCVVGSRAHGPDHDDSVTDRRGTRSPCSHRSRPPTCMVAVRQHLFGAPEQCEDNATQSCDWELQNGGRALAPHHGAQGEPERPGMSLLADGREGHASGRGTAGPAPGLPVADDSPDLRLRRHVAVQKAGHLPFPAVLATNVKPRAMPGNPAAS